LFPHCLQTIRRAEREIHVLLDFKVSHVDIAAVLPLTSLSLLFRPLSSFSAPSAWRAPSHSLCIISPKFAADYRSIVVVNLLQFSLELSLHDARLCKEPPSLLAAAALDFSCKVVSHPSWVRSRPLCHLAHSFRTRPWRASHPSRLLKCAAWGKKSTASCQTLTASLP
jgi:hypothetical protein